MRKAANECVHGWGTVGEKKDDFRISRDAQWGNPPSFRKNRCSLPEVEKQPSVIRGRVGAVASSAYEAVSGLQVQTEEARNEKTCEARIGNIRRAYHRRIHV